MVSVVVSQTSFYFIISINNWTHRKWTYPAIDPKMISIIVYLDLKITLSYNVVFATSVISKIPNL